MKIIEKLKSGSLNKEEVMIITSYSLALLRADTIKYSPPNAKTIGKSVPTISVPIVLRPVVFTSSKTTGVPTISKAAPIKKLIISSIVADIYFTSYLLICILCIYSYYRFNFFEIPNVENELITSNPVFEVRLYLFISKKSNPAEKRKSHISSGK